MPETFFLVLPASVSRLIPMLSVGEFSRCGYSKLRMIGFDSASVLHRTLIAFFDRPGSPFAIFPQSFPYFFRKSTSFAS